MCPSSGPHLGTPAIARMDDVKSLFSRIDFNGDGIISRPELACFLLKLGQPVGRVDAVLRQADADGNGLIDHNEFLEWLLSDDETLLTEVYSSPKSSSKLRNIRDSLSAPEDTPPDEAPPLDDMLPPDL